MRYKIPKESEIADLILELIKEHGVINSQTKLEKLVRRKLIALNPDYKITGQRVRAIAVQLDTIRLDVHCRVDGIREPPTICPVCGMKLKTIRNKTLYGWEVTVGSKCPRCPYWTGRKLRIPVRYIFTYCK